VSLFILSDLHIWGPDDPLYASLLDVLRNRAVSGDTVVLAGDLFDLFVGNKSVFLKRYSGFFTELSHTASRGVQIHYIEGNHDFLLKRAFRGIPNLALHPHHIQIEIAGKRFYFAHGDTVDRSDYSYRILRAFLRSPLLKAFVAIAPSDWIDWLGKSGSKKSRYKKPRLPTDLPLERMEYLRKIYRSFAAEQLAQGNDFVVMGHSHDLDEMFFNIGGRPGQYVNVGFPRVHGSFLSWSPGEEKIQRERLPEV
jgi:UDP-2,3-diacylglucosamine hydrolase